MKPDILFLKKLNKPADGAGLAPDAHYWRRRITSELLFAAKFSDELRAGEYDESVRLAVERLKELYRESGAVTKGHALEIEGALGEVSKAAKEYTVICAAHAHIDMNWMWSGAETTAVTLDTFRTALNLMSEYDGFIFSQSQASVYAIAEKYDPAMFQEIKRRVADKRWEITASAWVEADKNMPSGESLTRHILYAKKYFGEKFGVGPDELEIDFEPDTFGHSVSVPEILSHGGVKYYYHCRGREGDILYRFRSPSGAEVLAYREPEWYNAEIGPDMTLPKVEYYAQTGTKTALKVYGVGNHGGGPTRRDIERIIDMGTWPLAPVIKFGTYREFFKAVEPLKETFPAVDKELNYIFDGCYTSQSRIKAANRVAENRLFQAETLNAGAVISGAAGYGQGYFEEGWINTLFNHFHDILPGSCVTDSRESALGLFQDTLSRTNTAMTNAMRAISADIDTQGLIKAEDAAESVSEGAGAGMFVTDFVMPAAERGKGAGRIYHVFNNSPAGGKRLVRFRLWDWPGELRDVEITDCGGAPLPFQVMDGFGSGAPDMSRDYWGHSYHDLAAEVSLEPYGYATVALREKAPEKADFRRIDDPRVLHSYRYRMENERVIVDFDPMNMEIVSFVEKRSGKKLINNAGLKYVKEESGRGGSAWRTGRYMSSGPMEDARILNASLEKDALCQWIKYTCACGSSKLGVTVSLEKDAARVNYEITADWEEIGSAATFVPQLQYFAALCYETDEYLYDIPFGVTARTGLDHDVPGQSFACAKNPCGGCGSVTIFSKTKYGYRAFGGALALNLIHSTFDPDPYPEIGTHKIEFAVGAEDASENAGLLRSSAAYNCPPAALSGTSHPGSRAGSGRLFSLAGNVILSAVKLPEEPEKKGGDRIIARCYEPDGKDAVVKLSFGRQARAARFVDALERPIEGDVKTAGNEVEFEVKAYKAAAVEVEF